MSTSPAPSSNPKDHAPNQPSNTQYRSNAQTQGSVSDDKTNLSKRDTQSQPAKGARKVKEKGSGSPMDTASAEHGTKQRRSEGGSGNPEGVGFVDQVGSASGTANKFEGKD
ncbi:hypothetical protein DFP72DRAFT_808467 [Ephemerocybe angulata]|uniref:Uncharacterized protein n=1 Tax=Ephemerocybe angulata TaxID=980116 RepID=A0A8H6I3B0_9AGAR|nr:hypothetical protein DFP72DRAFT_808467 [Tulosesus angulatus]